jgi:hypothetical protein
LLSAQISHLPDNTIRQALPAIEARSQFVAAHRRGLAAEATEASTAWPFSNALACRRSHPEKLAPRGLIFCAWSTERADPASSWMNWCTALSVEAVAYLQRVIARLKADAAMRSCSAAPNR